MIGLVLWAWRTRRRIARGELPGWDTPQGQRVIGWMRVGSRLVRRVVD